MSAVGLRVIRGPGWSAGDDADGGEGHTGTLTEVKDDGSMEVTWDRGETSVFRAGSTELRVLDNATVGVRHEDASCDECGERDLTGMRWTCSQCNDYDLCSICYFGEKHDCKHPFDRYETPESEPYRVEQRNKSTKIRVMGIYPGATVTRGRHWQWADQDGGPGSKGQVLDVVSPDTQSARSTVKVEWTGNSFKNVYRLGHQGKVDLRFTEVAPGLECYPQHLPVFDIKNYKKEAGGDTGIAEGDNVVLAVSLEEFQQLQKASSGWAVGMSKCVGKAGAVKGFAANGDAIVSFGPMKYRLVPRALRKVPDVAPGDHVRVLDDEEKLQILQDGHGGYSPAMRTSLGKVGEVVKLDSDGDAVVQFGQQKWLFNAACLVPAPGQDIDPITPPPTASIRPGLVREESSLGALNELLGAVLFQAVAQDLAARPEKLMLKAVIDGDASAVLQLVQTSKDLANASQDGVSALHLAANMGNLAITKTLVEHGAELNQTDGDNDSPLLASFKHEPVAEYLISKGCDVTLINNAGQSAAHKAALFGHHVLLKQLIQKGLDMNCTDGEGDAPLHDAIGQGRHQAAEVLIGWPKIDLRRKNQNGFTPLHLCSMKDTATIAELLVAKDKSLVNEQKEDGFTPLHVAAINNHTDVMKVLLEKGGAKVDMKNNTKSTALHEAAGQAYMDAVQMLIEHGADVNVKDCKGNRPLHRLCSVQESDNPVVVLFRMLGHDETVKLEERLRIACYLLRAGADPESRGDDGKTALDTCTHQELKDGIAKFLHDNPTVRSQRPKTPALARGMSQSASQLCRKCLTKRANILFVPCGHKAACKECTAKHKLRACPRCNVTAKSRFDENGKEIGNCVVM